MSQKPVNLKSDFDPNIIGSDINEYLIKSEQKFSDIKKVLQNILFGRIKIIQKRLCQLCIFMDLQPLQKRYAHYLTL